MIPTLALAFMLTVSPLANPTVAEPVLASQNLTFEEAAEAVIYFDEITDDLPESAYPVIVTNEDIERWTREIVPYFGYEEITGPDLATGGFNGYTYPTLAEFAYFDDYGSQGQHHTIGLANCMSGQMWLNGRMANPVSPFYGRSGTLAVLVHELAHINGICFGPYTEQSAQLATLEILAAMVNKGTTEAFGPLMSTLEGMYASAAQGIARRDGRQADYEQLMEQVASSPFERAVMDKSARYWAADQDALTSILLKYNLDPMNDLNAALASNRCTYQSVVWDKALQDIRYETYLLDVPCIRGVQLPINQTVFSHPLVIDDLVYVIDHAEEFALYLMLQGWGELVTD